MDVDSDAGTPAVRAARPIPARRLVLLAVGLALFLALGSARQAGAAGLLTGTVRDASSAPVGSIDVTIYDPVFGVLLGSTTTQVDGTYGISLPAGSYRMMFHDPSGAFADRFSGGPTGTDTWVGSGLVVVADPGGGVQDAVLTANAAVTGAVTAPGGAVASGILVEVRTTSGTPVAAAVTDGSGSFTISGLTPGTYLVRYSDPAGLLGATYHPGSNVISGATQFTLGSGDTATANIELVTAGGVTGTVRVGGRPAPGIAVGVVDASSPEMMAVGVTDASGLYTVRGLAPASYKVVWVDLLLFTDPAHSLRPVAAPALDFLSLGPAASFAAAAPYTVTASSLAPIPIGQLVGAACDLTVFTPGSSHTSADLAGADFRGCPLTDVVFGNDYFGADLVSADFSDASLDGVVFGGLLSGANSEADLTSADFTRATLAGCTIGVNRLVGADFTDATILPSTTITFPTFTGAVLDGTVITGVDLGTAVTLTAAQLLATDHDWTGTTLPVLSYGGPDLIGVDFTTGDFILTNTVFTTQRLTDANFAGLTLTGTKFDKALLDATRFDGATLNGVSFVQATGTAINLSNTQVNGSTFTWGQFPGGNLAGAVFTGSSLYGAVFANGWAPNVNLAGNASQYVNFRYANVQGADFAGANLYGAYLEGAWVAGASFSNATISAVKVSGTHDLTQAQLLSAKRNWAYISFTGFNLSGIDFTGLGITVPYASFVNSNLTGTNFAGRNLTGVRLSGSNLTNATFAAATGTPWGGATATYSATTCPDGVLAPTAAPTCVGHGFSA